MGWHPDGVPGPAGTLEARAARTPYGPPDLLSTFTYVTNNCYCALSYTIVYTGSLVLDQLSDVRFSLERQVICLH